MSNAVLLNPACRRVLILGATGISAEEIAMRTGRCITTVRDHLRSLFVDGLLELTSRRLEVRSYRLTEAGARALRRARWPKKTDAIVLALAAGTRTSASMLPALGLRSRHAAIALLRRAAKCGLVRQVGVAPQGGRGRTGLLFALDTVGLERLAEISAQQRAA